MTAALSLLRERAVFAWIVFAIPPTSILGHAIAPGQAFFKGQDLGILSALALTALAALAWLPYRSTSRWSGMSLGFLAVAAVAWLYQVTRIQFDQALFNISAFVVPVILALLAMKRARATDLGVSLLVLAYGLVLISLVSLVFGKVGWIPDGFAVTDAGGARFAFLSWVGIPSRWSGPFGSVNYASPIGGLLVVLGAGQRGWHRGLLVIGGMLVLGLGQGRTALFAVAAGLIVVVLWSPRMVRVHHRTAIRVVVVTTASLIGLAYVALLDPTFNGRTPIWSNFIALLPENLLFGVGDSGINAFVVQHQVEPGFIPHVHAHSVMIDGLVRFGVNMAILASAMYVIALLLTSRHLRRAEDPGPMAIVVFVIVAGLAETLHSWDYWSVYLAVLTWAVLRSDSSSTAERDLPDATGRSLLWTGATGDIPGDRPAS